MAAVPTLEIAGDGNVRGILDTLLMKLTGFI